MRAVEEEPMQQESEFLSEPYDGPEPLWSTKKVATYLDVPVTTMHRWRRTGYGPTPRKIGKHFRYHPADVRKFLEESVAEPDLARG